MNTPKNKGEWSELYVFFKLLGDGRLYCGDGKLNRYDDKFYPILKVFRNDEPNRNSYVIESTTNDVHITGTTIDVKVSQEKFKEEAEFLLNHIKQIRGSENIDGIEQFMKEINCPRVCAKSRDKADIRIVIHNCQTGSKPELGYSIKSKLGADSTLINASVDSTNFIYRISGFNPSKINQVNNLNYFKDKFQLLNDLNASISFDCVAQKNLHNNLIMLDLGLERIIAECLLLYYSGKAKTVEDSVSILKKLDPLKICCSTQPFYEYKMKQFLLAFALGMTAATPWMGQFNANGGYVVVKEDGDVLCYHFFDRNDLEDYLFYNTRFETPSQSRHKFGFVYESEGNFYIKLNLQIRFK